MPAIPTDAIEDIEDISDDTADIRAAVKRVEESLRIVLAHIIAIQRQMANSQASSPYDVPLRPDDSWIGTP